MYYIYSLFYVAKTTTAVISNPVLYATITIDVYFTTTKLFDYPINANRRILLRVHAQLCSWPLYIRSSFIASGASVVYDVIAAHWYNVLCI